MKTAYIPVLESDLRAAIAIIQVIEWANTEDLTELRRRLESYLTTNPSMSWSQYKDFVEASR